jgi:hypothetical protein
MSTVVTDERSLLLPQVNALEDQLARVVLDLETMLVAPRLHERVHIRLEKLVAQRQQELKQLRKEIESGVGLDVCWPAYRALQRDCTALFRECLACIQGALARRAQLDEGLCDIADQLLDGLSKQGGGDIPWQRFTILADGDSFIDMAGIIRVRFPETSIWNLPVVAHEFGHYVGPVLEVTDAQGRSSHPFQNILEREARRDPRNRGYVHEFFADLFATYALGPAYACTCILLRFDPVDATKSGNSHPAASARVHTILRCLELTDGAGSAMMRPFGFITQELRSRWQRLCRSAGDATELSPDVVAPLNELIDELYGLLTSELPNVRYDKTGWLRAQRLAMSLDGKGALDIQREDTIADVLNAGWLLRFDRENEPYRITQLGERVRDACAAMLP